MKNWMDFRKWPYVVRHGNAVPGDVKLVTLEECTRLAERARLASGWSGTGRPRWMNNQAANIRKIYLSVFCLEAPGVYRCTTSVDVGHGRLYIYPLDVSVGDFKRLTSLGRDEAIHLLHSFLELGCSVPVEDS